MGEGRKKERHYYTLSFELYLEAGDISYVAYTQPYTLSDLSAFLDATQADEARSLHMKR